MHGISISSEDRYKIAASLFHLSMEHHGSIHMLVVEKRYGSAFALLRPQFEAFIRGTWFHLCANEAQITSFKNDKEPPHINKLIANIEETPSHDSGELKQAKENTWATLCGYTHGGYYQVAHRNTATEITGDYNKKYIINLLNKSDSITLLSLSAIASLIDSEQLAIGALEQYDSVFGDTKA